MFHHDKCLIIAEVAQAHDGSLGFAHAFVDAVARRGVDAIKFQTHYADAESSADEPFRIKFSRQDATRYEYWKRLEFTPDEWRGLAEHCREKGILFISSPFSDKAVDVLQTECDVPLWKVASGEVTNNLLLDRMCATGKPVILSSGMSSWSELDAAVARVRRHGNELAVLQCTTAYPCPPEAVGLEVMEELRRRYGCFAGLSDHSGTIYPGLAAATLGASVLELHVTFHREAFGPDVPASVTLEELEMLTRGIRFVEAMRGSVVDKDKRIADMGALRGMFQQGVVAARNLPAGHRLAAQDLSTRKPLRGVAAADYESVVGRVLKRSLAAAEPVAYEDLES